MLKFIKTCALDQENDRNLSFTGRVFPGLFTHGGDKALIGGTHKGGHRPYGGLTLIDYIIN